METIFRQYFHKLIFYPLVCVLGEVEGEILKKSSTSSPCLQKGCKNYDTILTL